MDNKLLKSALYYREKLNWSVIPIAPGKKTPPLIPWEEFQKRLPTSDEIKQWWGKWPNANIAIVTGRVSNLFVIDHDKYKDGYDVAASLKYIPGDILTPCAKSPRGGVHQYYIYPKNYNLTISAGKISGIDTKGEGGIIAAPPSVNENGKAYEWVLKPNEVKLSSVPESFLTFLSSPGLSTNVYKSPQVSTMFTEGRRDEDLFHTAHCLVKGGMNVDEVYRILEIISDSCVPPFPKDELKIKIESALKRGEGRERMLSKEVRDLIERLQKGTINLHTVYESLHVSTREEKKNISIILKRFEERDRLIAKTHGRAGEYRIIDPSMRTINLNDKSDIKGELDIKWPLGIEAFIRTMPKTVYILAGETDSGKTGYALNFAHLNYPSGPINYFSSEMGKEEILDRGQYLFGANYPNNFMFHERSVDFDDVIDPDAINIIDYVKLFDEFYKMAELIENIGQKLNKGIALILIQKPHGRKEGLGGERTKDLCRLYLSMEPGKMSIEKAKNWRNNRMNPNHFAITYKIVDGCKFVNPSTWKKEEC